MRLRTTAIAGAALAAFSALAGAQAIVIDDFNTPSATISLGSAGGTVTRFDDATAGNTILQTERNLRLASLSSGGGAFNLQVSFGSCPAGQLCFNRAADVVNSSIEAWWDGNNDTNVFVPTGLGGINLTAGGQDRIRLTSVGSSSTTLNMRVVVWTDGTSLSQHDFTLPAGAGTVDLPYANFTTAGTNPANFASVGAIYLRVVEPAGAWSAQLGQIATAPVELLSFSVD
jgi:hypothetical protein